ncbi:concanavalin A-like lectin/glucanase domain-containing protein, partial [Multifurca ochricompacta]
DNAGMVRTNYPIPPACGIYYYEIEVLSKAQKAHISIGFASGDTRLNKLPGWEKNSWGYHGDDGFSFSAEKAGNAYGPTFGGGDIVGAGIDFTQNRAFFTKNGTLIGMVFEHVACDVQVFPSVGLRHSNEAVRVNFGHASFKYDIDDHVQQRRDAVWASIQCQPLDWRILNPAREASGAHTSRADITTEYEGHDEAARLVFNYLIHHGYAKTAEALQAQLARAPTRAASPALPVPPPTATSVPAPEIDSPMQPVDREENEIDEPSMLEQRLTIVRAVRRGNVEGALNNLGERFPDVLARDGGIVRLKLRCRQFVELVNAAAEAKRAFSASSSGSHPGAEDVDAMDVDDDAPAQSALKAALTYGRALRTEYRKEAAERPEVHALLERTWSVIAYHFPVEAGGEIGRWAGQDARDTLAGEVNQAILESQGFPRRPTLERVYRQTGASLIQLGFLGVGAAVFADMQRELLD